MAKEKTALQMLIDNLQTKLILYENLGDYDHLPRQIKGQIDGLTIAISEAKLLMDSERYRIEEAYNQGAVDIQLSLTEIR